MKKFLTKKYIIGAVTVLVLVGYFIFANGNKKLETVVVERKTVALTVVATGKTKARSEVDLAFDQNGRVARSYVEVGDRVSQGQVIAELDMRQSLSDLAKQKSILAEEEAKYQESSRETYLAILDGYSTSDNAVRNKTDQFFKTPRTNPSFEVKFSDGNYDHYFSIPADTVNLLNAIRREVETILINWQTELVQINEQNAGNYTGSAINNMNKISNFLDKVAYAINSFTSADFAYEATVAGYKTAVDTARSTVATAKEKITSISADKARIDQANASIISTEASLSKSKIVAPFSGTVTRQEAKVGEAVQSGDQLVSVISESDMYVEANVSEINIGKVKISDTVQIEFDAYPEELFQGKVSFIDPGETVIDQVVNYKIRVDFEENILNLNSKIRSGLTANLTIISKEKPEVLTVPIYSLIEEEDRVFVNKIIENKTLKIEVIIGLRGIDGLVEVVSGLTEGDIVLVPN